MTTEREGMSQEEMRERYKAWRDQRKDQDGDEAMFAEEMSAAFGIAAPQIAATLKHKD